MIRFINSLKSIMAANRYEFFQIQEDQTGKKLSRLTRLNFL